MPCIDSETLHLYIDDELDAEARAAVEEELGHCSHCAERLQSIQTNNALLLEALHANPAMPQSRPDHCLQPEQLSAYVSQQVAPGEIEAIEQHLQTCVTCLSEVREMRQMMQLLEAEPLLDPPPHLVARALGDAMAKTPQTQVASAIASGFEQLGILVIDVTQAGLSFVDTLLKPDHVQLTLGRALAPAGVLRNIPHETPAHAAIEVQGTVGDLDLDLQIVHQESKSVAIRIRIRKASQALSERRVTLFHDGYPGKSEMTSANGEIDFTHVDPGDYTVRISQERVELGLKLQ